MIAQVIGLYKVAYVGVREKATPTGKKDIQTRLGLKNVDNKKEATIWATTLCGVKSDFKQGMIIKDLLLDINFFTIKDMSNKKEKNEYLVYLLDYGVVGEKYKQEQVIIEGANTRENIIVAQDQLTQPKEWEVTQQASKQEETDEIKWLDEQENE